MWSIGTYERFLKRIAGEDGDAKTNLFGVLLIDGRQREAREYVLNYMDVFNSLSSTYINFYVPGYFQESDDLYVEEKSIRMKIKGKGYYFNEDEYIKFCNKFELNFNVSFPFIPTLVLLECHGVNFSKSKKIIIELDEDIKRAGELFTKIFNIAKQNYNLKGISYSLSEKEKLRFIGGGIEAILEIIGINLEPIIDPTKKIRRFKIKK